MRKVLLALGLLIYCGELLANEAIPASTVYNANPQHLWNQMSSTLFARVAPEGTVYGLSELDILYWQSTEHLLTEPSHSAAIRLLDRFIHSHGERLIQDPFKRALLQRDLWQLFDWVAASDPLQTVNVAQRAELEDRLAVIIRRLALSDAQIAALPDNYAAAGPHPDLPRGLFAPDSEWVTARSRDSGADPLASSHIAAFNGHSVFLVMVRLPQGRQQTVDYLNSLRDFGGPLVYAQQRDPRWADHTRYSSINPDVPNFPPGTEWALVRRMCVIDRQGRIQPTALTESIQLRRYDSADRRQINPGGLSPIDGKPAAQQVFEFEMDRLREGALKPLAPDDMDFQFVHFRSTGGDPFELPSVLHGEQQRTPNPTAVRQPTLATCYQCHSAPGILSVLSFNRIAFSNQFVQRLQATPDLPPEMAKSYTPPPNSEEEIDSTVRWKYRQFDWGLLKGLWRRLE